MTNREVLDMLDQMPKKPKKWRTFLEVLMISAIALGVLALTQEIWCQVTTRPASAVSLDPNAGQVDPVDGVYQGAKEAQQIAREAIDAARMWQEKYERAISLTDPNADQTYHLWHGPDPAWETELARLRDAYRALNAGQVDTIKVPIEDVAANDLDLTPLCPNVEFYRDSELALVIHQNTTMVDVNDPNCLTDASIRLLATSGRICRVLGHRWHATIDATGESALVGDTCVLCGKAEAVPGQEGRQEHEHQWVWASGGQITGATSITLRDERCALCGERRSYTVPCAKQEAQQ